MYKIKVNDKYNYAVDKIAGEILINGEKSAADIRQLDAAKLHVINNLQSYNVEVVSFNAAEKNAEIKVNGNIYTVNAKDQFDLLLEQMGMSNLTSSKISELKAPMPGLVLKVFVEEGTEVKKGDNLFILEAMKMENIIKSPDDVVVKKVKIKPGDKVEKGQVLLQF